MADFALGGLAPEGEGGEKIGWEESGRIAG